MASTSELPLPLFLEQSSSFCSCLRNDLDKFIDEIGNSFLSINRTAKIAPRQRRKNKRLDGPGSCTLDLKEFTTSKQNALHNLQASFETMELKWSDDIAELKDWFLKKIEVCVSKVQLEIKVSAEDLNLAQPVHEVELCESSSEVDKISVDEPLDPCRYHAASPPVSSHSRSKESMGSHSSPPPPINTRRIGKREVGTRQVKRGAKSAMLSKKEISPDSSIPDSGIEEPLLRSKRSNWQSTDVSCTLGPPGNIDTNGFQENIDLICAASPPLENAKKMGKKATGVRNPMKRGAKATQWSEEVTSSSTVPGSGIEVLAMKNKRSNWEEPDMSSALVPPDAIDTNIFQENTDLIQVASPPPENTKKMGKRVTGVRNQMKRGAKATQLSEEVTSGSAVPGSGIEMRAMKNKRLNWEEPGMSSALVPPDANIFQENTDLIDVASPPLENTKKMGKRVTGVRNHMKRGAKATQLSEEVTNGSIVPGSGIEVLAMKNKRSNWQEPSMSSALVPPDTNVFQENTDLICAASPPPVENTKKMSKRGTGVRNQTKRGAKVTQLSKEVTSGSSIPNSGVEVLSLRNKRSNWQEPDMSHSLVPSDTIDTSVFEENTDLIHAASPPALENTKKMGKRGTGVRNQVKRGAKATQVSKEEIASIPNSSIEKPTVRSKVSDNDIPCELVPAGIISSTVFQENTDSLHAVRPPATTKKMGKKGTGRAQMKKGFAIDGPALRNKASDLQDMSCALGPSGVSNNVFPEIMGSLHLSSPPPANTKKMGKKGTGRAQRGAKATLLSQQEITNDANFGIEPVLRSKMTDWQGLLGAVENAPCKPGLYEVKVWRAKKPAYIGHTNDLQKSILQHRDGHSSGEKHLDQFIQRNKDDVSVRFEVYPSLQLAKLEQKKRLKDFMEKHKNLPSYNYGL